jgi:hypothetical protein
MSVDWTELDFVSKKISVSWKKINFERIEHLNNQQPI